MVGSEHPTAAEGVHATPVGDELLVHLEGADETHLLNSSTAAVWQRCDGQTSVSVLESVFAEAPAEHRAGLVQTALDQLQAAGLLLNGGTTSDVDRESRRRFLQRAALAAVAVPTITTLVTATPAAAASIGDDCVNNADCDSPLVCRGPVGARTCQNPGTATEVCDENADCASGICQSGTCRTGSGGNCSGNDAECANTLVCRGGTCQTPGTQGQVCETTSDCTSGLQCVSGLCRSVLRVEYQRNGSSANFTRTADETDNPQCQPTGWAAASETSDPTFTVVSSGAGDVNTTFTVTQSGCTVSSSIGQNTQANPDVCVAPVSSTSTSATFLRSALGNAGDVRLVVTCT